MSLYQLIQASAHHLPMLADKSVHAVVCSPPYWSLRQYAGEQDVDWPTIEYSPMPGLPPIRIQGCEPDCDHEWAERVKNSDVRETPMHGKTRTTDRYYGDESRRFDGNHQKHTAFNVCRKCGGMRCPLGLEPTVESYIGHLILCLREWSRLLHPTGTIWVNLGDSYAGSWGNYAPRGIKDTQRPRTKEGERWERKAYDDTKFLPPAANTNGLKPKNLIGVPWRFAFAAQAEGFYLRSDVIWAKGVSFLPDYAGSCMPESTKDRFTRSHEHIFMLSKKPNYYFDMEAIKEPGQEHPGKAGTFKRENGKRNEVEIPGQGYTTHREERDDRVPAGRQPRDVWIINPQPSPIQHYAIMPEKIPEIAIKCATSERGVCPACLAPWTRLVERNNPSKASNVGEDLTNGAAKTSNPQTSKGLHRNGGGVYASSQVIGWQPGCSCNAGEPIGATVLDPFCGSGTTLRVAIRLGRRAVGVDTSAEYIRDLAPDRLTVQMQMPV